MLQIVNCLDFFSNLMNHKLWASMWRIGNQNSPTYRFLEGPEEVNFIIFWIFFSHRRPLINLFVFHVSSGISYCVLHSINTESLVLSSVTVRMAAKNYFTHKTTDVPLNNFFFHPNEDTMKTNCDKSNSERTHRRKARPKNLRKMRHSSENIKIIYLTCSQ